MSPYPKIIGKRNPDAFWEGYASEYYGYAVQKLQAFQGEYRYCKSEIPWSEASDQSFKKRRRFWKSRGIPGTDGAWDKDLRDTE